MNITRTAHAALVGLLVLGGCGPRLAPIMRNGDILPSQGDRVVEQARVTGEGERARIASERASIDATALATCAPSICDSVTRGEVAIGMNETQVLAATRTTADAWETRPGGVSTVLTVRPGGLPVRDVVGELASVSLQSGMVTGYTYREAQGFRTVATAADATLAGRSAARAEALLRQGDEYTAAGRLDLALDYYDRADVIRPAHAETNFRIASTLDKQLRPIEAVMRYQLFIHQMELEKIGARGDAAAKIAEAIARAHERIIVLERR
jgi:tetratricopeptide (TPR) repeat protein